MKVQCAYSGLSFQIPGFPGFLPSSCGYIHPAHFLKLDKLSRSVSLFINSPESFNEESATLLFSSLLSCSGKVRFYYPLPSDTPSQAYKYIPRLFTLLGDIFALPPSAQESFIPVIAIQKEMDNWKELLEDWEQGISRYYEGIHKQLEREKIESLTSRVKILSHKRDALSLARKLNSIAEWAAIAGEFPTWETISPSGNPILCADYWKEIIRNCSTSATLLNYPIVDINDMLDHCYAKIAVGEEMAHELFGVIEGALERRENYLKFGTDDIVSISAVGSRIIFDETYIQTEDKEKEEETLKKITSSAPSAMPNLSDYPDKISFLRAKMAYTLAQKEKGVSK